MSKSFKWLAMLLGIACLSIIGCSDSSSSESPDVAPGTLGTADPALIAAAGTTVPANDVVLFYYRPDGNYSDWGLWLWDSASQGGQASYTATKGKAEVTTSNGVKIAYWNISTLCNSVSAIKTLITNNENINLLIRNDSWTKDPGTDQVLSVSTAKKFMVLSGDSGVYEVSDNIVPTITSAVATSNTKIKVSLSVNYGIKTSPDSNGFTLVANDDSTINITDVVNYANQNDRNKNNAKVLLMTLESSIDTSKIWKVKHSSFVPNSGCTVSVQGAVKEAASYTGNDLGLTLNGNSATFKTWAPVANDVKVLLYTSAADVGNFAASSVSSKAVGQTTDSELLGSPSKTEQMTRDSSTGVWTCNVSDVSGYKYYKYQIVNSGTTYYVADIWGYCTSPDSIASQITNINSDANAIPTGYTKDTSYGDTGYYNPFSGSKNSDAVVYEMHVTDWAYAEDSENTGNVGKYLTIAKGTKVIPYIKALGVTHVQLLPVFEFAETNANTGYNWGYNPYHYNAPEGRYVTSGYTDGTQAVKELRELIAAFHEAGIAVIMDVVYNHTSGTLTGSLYDSTVPYYFYRFDSDGNYSNGSGCGNEIDAEATMAKKYIIDSLKHWMKDYHFNGFRFDLMGVLSKETMKEIYDELYQIDPKVMVYGEPWTGGTAQVTNGATQAVDSTPYGVGAFDDDFRDAIKGAEFGGFSQGQVQGTFKDSDIVSGLNGKSGKNNRNKTGKNGLSMHYVECHDNYTLFDKLAISYWMNKNNKTDVTTGDLFTKIGTDGLAVVKKWDTLSAAYVLLSQGTAFLNGGQEFLRTKRGNENSYNVGYGINGINLSFATTYSDVCNTYKGLIALRQSNLSAFGSASSASATTVKTGVTKYVTGDFLVYFNATDADEDITTTGYTKVVDVTSGTPTESTTLPTSVPAKGFVILKK